MKRSKLATKYLRIFISLVVVVGLVAGLIRISHNQSLSQTGPIQIVAAENFWGSLAAQLGGSKVKVISIVSDPNADPHEYEVNDNDAREFAKANYVILNGAGYDSWGDKLLAASPNPKRQVLDVATLLGKKDGDNPHFWYSPNYVNRVVDQMEQNLISIDPSNKTYFVDQYKTLSASLAGYQQRIATIKAQFAGTKVATTEDIFAYLAAAAGLDLISPPSFTQAVAEGNDPPTDSVVQFQQQLESGQVKVLVYNEQTVNLLTTSMKVTAAQQNIAIVGVTETIQPPDTAFQVWMNAELLNLQNALNARALGQ
jgi:zinc/manganese transport system substrate-binding protein